MNTETGRLTDLAPDGLGFIIPTGRPNERLGFLLRDNPKATRLREGQRVRFQLNEKRQVEGISPA